MEYRTLEVNLISAKDLNKVNLISKMDVYAIVTIEGGGDKARQKNRTPVSNDGDTNPVWNYSMKFTVDENLAKQNRLTLQIKLRCERALGDKDIGEVFVPVKELLESSGADAKEGKMQFVSYQVRKPSGKPKGQINLSYKFGEKVSGPANFKAEHEPMTAYPAPAGTSAPYPPPPPNVYPPPATAAAAPYPPPKAGEAAPAGHYPPPPKVGESSAYAAPPLAGYPQGPPPAAGYPPQPPPPGYGYGYPPPPPYGGYPPPGGYGYPPQPGYGYPPQQPPKKNKFGMGLGAGLLGGALGGLLIGDMISDAGSYDAGYDAGFDDAGGFDF